MNVLVDTSVWVDHFRKRNDALVELIETDLTLIHPMVVAEIARAGRRLPLAPERSPALVFACL